MRLGVPQAASAVNASVIQALLVGARWFPVLHPAVARSLRLRHGFSVRVFKPPRSGFIQRGTAPLARN